MMENKVNEYKEAKINCKITIPFLLGNLHIRKFAGDRTNDIIENTIRNAARS